MKIELEVKPWTTPNYITAGTDCIHIKHVDPMKLSEQIDRFRADVFRKAGKKDPRAGATHD